MNQKLVIGLDIGGTKIDVGIIEASGKILRKIRILTNIHEGLDAIVQRIYDAIEKITDGIKTPIRGIGIGAPGQVDVKNGIVLFAPNLGWKNINLKKIIYERYRLPVEIENDANCGALAEAKLGAGSGANSLIWITVGTGIGGGIIIDGKLMQGAGFAGGEIGHMTMKKNGLVCGCGNKGCLETLSAGPAIIHQIRKKIISGTQTNILKMVDNDLNKITVGITSEAADMGDNLSLQILNRAGEYLGIGVANLVNILNPEAIILGGGVMEAAGRHLLKIIKDTVQNRALSQAKDNLRIELAKLGSDAGLIGASLLICNRSQAIINGLQQ
ncbi:ROK family protein [Candidatus Desantisbacteria bacterium]|nr:ROK family protein [Candidatus Desantisbacteria bacterium]